MYANTFKEILYVLWHDTIWIFNYYATIIGGFKFTNVSDYN